MADQVYRAEACINGLPRGTVHGIVLPPNMDKAPAVFGLYRQLFKEIHGRLSHKFGYKAIFRSVENLGGRTELTQHSVLHHGNPGSEGKGFPLVVSHIEKGCAQRFVQLTNNMPHLNPQCRG